MGWLTAVMLAVSYNMIITCELHSLLPPHISRLPPPFSTYTHAVPVFVYTPKNKDMFVIVIYTSFMKILIKLNIKHIEMIPVILDGIKIKKQFSMWLECLLVGFSSIERIFVQLRT